MQNIVLEACVETYEQAIRAEQKGAHRIELCSSLEHGGLTPDQNLTERLLKELNIPVKVMIRPRAGDFVYTTTEVEQMAEEIRLFKKMGVKEIVLGLLHENGTIHLEQMLYLANIAAPLQITFHKAIDETNDPISELKRMVDLPKNVNSILTSGKQPTAKKGHALLKEMVEQFDYRFNIIAAGKVTDQNLALLHQLIGAKEYHGRKIVGVL